jgi:hypothetical protein
MNSPSIKAAAIPASTNVGVESIVKPNKPSSRINQEAWYDIEDGCYVLKDTLLPLETDDLDCAVAQDNHCLLELSQGASSPHSDGNAQCMLRSTFRKHHKVPLQLKSWCLLRSMKSGPSNAFSNAQGSGLRQRKILSSNCCVCQSSSAYQLRHAMRRMCQQRLRRVLRRLIPKSLLESRDPRQGSGGRRKMIQD